MNRSTPLRGVAAFVAVVALLVLAVAATDVFGRSVTPTPSPTPSEVPASPAPSTPPSTPPSPEPTVEPSDPPADGPFELDLDNATDHDVSVVIDDTTGSLVDAKSGRPGDGMTVRWSDSKVENFGNAETLRIVWVGLPMDDVVRLSISKTDGKYRLDFVQAAPLPNTDATGYDRILVLEFDEPVVPEDVTVTFEERG